MCVCVCVSQVVDAANLLIQDDERVGTVLLVMAKHGLMEWVPARQNLRPLTIAAGTHAPALPRRTSMSTMSVYDYTG